MKLNNTSEKSIMCNFSRSKIIVIASLLSCVFSTVSVAAGSVYKYNEGGSVIYQDRPPASSQDEGHAILNHQGVTLRSIPSREQRLIIRAEREAARREKIRDRALLATFSAEEDLIRTRDDRIGMIDGLINRLDDRIRVLSERLSIIDSRIDIQESNGGSAHESLYAERQSILRNIENAWSLVDSKAAERTSLMRKFKDDLVRYRQLKANR